MKSVVVVGGGIVGLASALAIQKRWPDTRITVLEKEPRVANHQTGHNSGVIHAGVYYKPGSLKARLCHEGRERMYAFCEQHGLPHQRCGKLIVATRESELERLQSIFERATANGIPGIMQIGPEQMREIEPHVQGVAAIWSPNTGIADYRAVAETMRGLLINAGADVRLNSRVIRLAERPDGVTAVTNDCETHAEFLLNCAGLHSDDVARMLGVDTDVRIVPFRGEYYFLKPERRSLVRGLIYPVPDPNFPFLGVHVTITVHGDVEAGPNAVFALAKEGYRKTDVNLSELTATLNFPGFQRLAARWWRVGAYEIYRSVSRAEFVRSLQTLVPDVRPEDVIPGGAGVRAQAVAADGTLIDDFRFARSPRSLHVLNAPSPGATASLAIGDHIASEI
jgi:(S)-2-hydroxyglutarate dehydrogenase